MNNYGDEASPWCSFHPKEVVVGVCALCLRERLINLALEQENFHISKDSNRSFRFLRRRASISLPKVFALSSLLHRLESRRQRSDDDSSDQGSIASLEDSFISIKFEDNGQASWESKKQEITDHMPKESSREKSVVEHVRSRGALRWRKKIGQLLQLPRWKRPSKAGEAFHCQHLFSLKHQQQYISCKEAPLSPVLSIRGAGISSPPFGSLMA
ncbi:uncharacterized protein LOC109826905 [Asparagus officinalis]|uniref:uncharacterized protein LOC109826905 n=1 Tax=Asparagus officinalis TaxID=4686 RepID=UPI00098E091D|nr:uncharacterized protein LOC109826905 [Asparagus officinalis]